MSGFTRARRGGHVVATFSGFEADLIRSLASQLVELLHNEQAIPSDDEDPLAAMFDFTGPTTAPEDPVLQRLFPTAYLDDDEAAGEFRRFTEGSLRETKSSNASVVIDTLEAAGLPDQLGPTPITIDVELDDAAAHAWLLAFADMRLALAVRLGVEEDDDEYWAGLSDEDPRAQAHDIYLWAGYLQETLVEAISS